MMHSWWSSYRLAAGRVTAFFILILSTGSLPAFQWPVEDKIVTATFGESRWDHFHTGVDIGGGAQIVRPIDAGEVIFSDDGTRRRNSLSYGLGVFLVVEHDQGIRSLYAHLDSEQFGPPPERVTENSELGVIGDTGASLGKHLHFEIIDMELGNYVNPLVVLPALRDTRKPDIRGISILGAESNGEPVALKYGSTVASDEYRLLIELYDLSEYVAYFCPMAPYQIAGFFNGSQVFDLRFDNIRESSGRLVLGRGDDSHTFDELYFDEWVINAGVVPFRVGEIQIEIVVSDMFGNEASYRVPVTVK